MTNLFLDALRKHNILTENGAVSNNTTGNILLDQFSKSATYKNRDIQLVFDDMSAAFGESPLISLYLTFYLRMITRKLKGDTETEKVQSGQGVRDESFKRFVWLARYQPDIFYKNMWLIPVVGTWKDLWHETLIHELNRDKVYGLVAYCIQNYNKELIAKYLPRIRSKSNTRNQRHKDLNKWVIGFCKFIGWTEKEYRKFKSTGQAHVFQRTICSRMYDKIDWKTIPGKALNMLTVAKGSDNLTFIERHGLVDNYIDWLKEQPTAKFTGYVHDLFLQATIGEKLSLVQKMTIDKQFDGLIELGKQNEGGIHGNVICALDTSESMTWPEAKLKDDLYAYDICLSLGIYFSNLNSGYFKDQVIMFSNMSDILKLSGTFSDKVNQLINGSTYQGGTNFQSVIDEIVRVRLEDPNIPIEDFPETLIVVSDMQFNPSGRDSQTNYEVAMKKLSDVGLRNMKIVWWWVTGRKKDFPSTIEDNGVTMIGGYDPSIITLLLGGEQTTIDKTTGEVRQLNAYEQMLKALTQEILLEVKL